MALLKGSVRWLSISGAGRSSGLVTESRELEGGRHGRVPDPDLRGRERLRHGHTGCAGSQVMEAHNRFAEQVEETRRQDRRRPCAAADQHRHLDPRRRGHRRPVRRDQGGPRRLLPDRGARTWTTRSRSASSARPASAASRSGRSWCSTACDQFHRRRSSRRPRAAAPDRGPGRTAPTRLAPSPTRTVASGPSCSPRRCASPATSTWPRSACRTPTCPRCDAWSAAGRAAQPGGLADHRRPAPGARPAAPGGDPAPQAAAAGRAGRARRRGGRAGRGGQRA